MKGSNANNRNEIGKVKLIFVIIPVVLFIIFLFAISSTDDLQVSQLVKEDKSEAPLGKLEKSDEFSVKLETKGAISLKGEDVNVASSESNGKITYFEAPQPLTINFAEAAKEQELEDYLESEPIHAPLPTPLPEAERNPEAATELPSSYKPQPRPTYGYSARETPITVASTIIDERQGISPGSGGTPPDTNGAVGPNHILTTTNGQFRITERDSGAVTTINKSTLFPGISDLFDPRAVFDQESQRFFVVMAANRRSANSGVAIAASMSNDPTGTWKSWLMDFDDTNTYWADYPGFGYSSDKLTVSMNSFSNSGDSFNGVRMFVVNKASAIAGGGLIYARVSSANDGGSFQPTQNLENGANTQFFLRTGTSNIFGTGRLDSFKITGSVDANISGEGGSFTSSGGYHLGSLTFSKMSSSTIGLPWSISLPDAPQLGTTANIETNDTRLDASVYRNGSIWVAHGGGVSAALRDRAAVHWWEISATTGAAIQDGFIMDETTPDGAIPNPTAMHYYYPSISVNKDGDVMVAYSGSSGGTYVCAYYSYRRADDPLGYMDPPKLIKAGAGPVSTSRWGDYSATMVDPVDDTKFWTVQEYAETGNKYGIWWGQVAGESDTTAPTVSAATATSSTKVRVTFNESMLNNAELRDSSNYTFTGGGVSLTASAVSVVSGTEVDLTVNQMTNAASYTVTVSTNITDLSGNALNSSSRVAGFSGAATALSVTLSSTAPSLTNVSPIPVTVSFSASVTGFVAGDLSLTNATAANFSGSGANYSFNLVPSGQGTVSVSIPSGSATDGFNNANGAGSVLSRTYDSVKPVATFSSTAPSPTEVSPIPFTVSFSEVVSGFVLSDLSVTNGAASNLQTVSAQSYSFDVTPSSDATVTVSLPANRVSDSASNSNNASSSYSRIYESGGGGPNGGTPVLTSLSCSAGTYITTLPFTCNVVFSASVSNFVVGDISLTNATATNFSGSAKNYSFSVTGSSQGAVKVKINAGVATDSSANANEASTEVATIYDSIRPTATLSSGTSNPTNSASIAVQVSLSEAVSSFNTSSLVVENATVSNFNGSGLNYSFTLTPSAQGVVRVEIPAGRLTDAAGNTNSTNPLLSRTFDSVAPPAPEISVAN